MPPVKFSVVIPTRERAATLRHALRTCLDQNCGDYEIIVSDNDSSPPTKAVVDELGCEKVRYVRTPGALSLCSSWEFAVSHARGEYVTLIGDDDGLLPHSLGELEKLTRDSKAKVIRWESAFYTWPSVALPGQGNYLRIPLGWKTREVESAAVIRDVVAFRESYTALPMLYNSLVHRDVLAALRARTGRVFPNPYADVYSGFAVAHEAGRFLSTEVPMSLSGQSGASNGVAMFFHRGRSPIDREFRDLNAAERLRPDPCVPDLAVFPYTPVADSFLHAKRLLFPEAADLELDRRRLVRACVKHLRAATGDDWRAGLAALRSSLADQPGGVDWFDAEFGRLEYRPPEPFRLRPDRMGFDGRYLHLDAAAFGVEDSTAAARLCDRVLNYRTSGVHYTGTDDSQADYFKRLCEERQEVIDGLRRVCDERLGIINRLNNSILARMHRLVAWPLRSVRRALRPSQSRAGRAQ
jgi:hypothetical protein